MNRKGIMLKFLLTIILAILIFAPTCTFLSKVFRVSMQAEQNFNDFVDEIKYFSSQTYDKTTTVMLVMDDKTAIIGFNKGEPLKGCLKEYGKECVSWEPPTECTKGETCVCLFKTFSVNEFNFDFTTPLANCVNAGGIEFSAQISDASILSYGNREFYLENGFIISRAEDPSFQELLYYQYSPYYFKNRRNPVLLKQLDQATDILVCLNSLCEPIQNSFSSKTDRHDLLLEHLGFNVGYLGVSDRS